MVNKTKSFFVLIATILLLIPITVLATHSENKFFRGETEEKLERLEPGLAEWIWDNKDRYYSYVLDEKGHRVPIRSINFEKFLDLINDVAINKILAKRAETAFKHQTKFTQAVPKPVDKTNIYASYTKKEFIKPPVSTSLLGKKEYQTKTLTDSQIDELIKACSTVFHSILRKNILIRSVPRDELSDLVLNPAARSNNACINNVLKDFGL